MILTLDIAGNRIYVRYPSLPITKYNNFNPLG